MMERPQKISCKKLKLWALVSIYTSLAVTIVLKSMKTSRASRQTIDLGQRIIVLNWIMNLSFLRTLSITIPFRRRSNSPYLMPSTQRALWNKTITTSGTSRLNTSPKWLLACINLLLSNQITRKTLSLSMHLGLVQVITQESTLNFWRI